MGSSLGRLQLGEETNTVAMKLLIEKYEELKREHGSSSDSSFEGATGSVIPGMSDQALFRELERALLAPRPAYHEATTREGTTVSASLSGIGYSLATRGPPTVYRQYRHGQRHRPAVAATAVAPHAPCVLVVDDSNVSCHIAKRSLSGSNIGVVAALSGELGLALLESDPSAFDLVLLDIVMPGLDGLQVLDRMKKDPRLCHIPVVVLSGLEDVRLAEACIKHGAVEVLHKPMSTSQVVRLVNAHCDMSRTTTAPVPAVESVSPPRSSPSGDASSGGGDAGGAEDASWRSPFEGGMGQARVAPSSATTRSHAAAAAARTARTATVTAPPDKRSDDTTGATRSPEPSAPRKATILVVDDSVISSKLAIYKLRLLGYETLIAENGKSALKMLRKYPGRVSLLLVDIIMPVMNGIELLQVLKCDPALRHIPVLVVSSVEAGFLDTFSVEDGVLAVLKKPLDVGEFQKMVAREGLALPTPPP